MLSKSMEVVYFELNNWFCERDYPNEEPFLTWMHDKNSSFPYKLLNENFVKENELCVIAFPYDMSLNFLVTAKKSWVEKTCPSLLTKFTKFLRFPDEEGKIVSDKTDSYEFLEYKIENIGIIRKDDPLWNEYSDEEDDD